MPSLLLEIGANIAKLQSDLSQAQRSIDGFGKAAKTVGQAVAGIWAASGMVNFLKESTQAFMEQENAINKMSVAMKNQGSFSKAALQDMIAFSSQIENTTATADEAALAVMANLKSYGMLDSEVKKATKVALDFAAAKKDEGMTVTQASEIIGKAYMGQTERLKKYVGAIDETKSKAERFDEVMKRVQGRFGGAAAAELDTYGGQVAQLGNLWGNVREDIGQVNTKIQVLLMPTIRDLIGELKLATEGMLQLFGTGRQIDLQRRRDEILKEIHVLEGQYLEVEQAASPGLMKRLWEGFTGTKSGAESAAQQMRALKEELMGVSAELAKLDAKSKKVEAGGSRTIVPDKQELDRSKSEYQKFLNEVEREAERSQKTIEAQNTNQYENMEKLLKEREKDEKEFADERMKLYRKMGEDEEKAMYATTVAHKKELEKQSKYAEQAARNMQDAFADLFFDAISGDLDGFSEYWNSFWDSMKKVFANSLADMALSWGTSALKNIITGKSGDSIVGVISGALSGAGEWLGNAAGSVWDTVADLFHTGGLVTGDKTKAAIGADEVLAVLQKGEYVLPKDVVSGLGLAGQGLTGPAQASAAAISGIIGAIGSLATGGMLGAVAAIAQGAAGYGSSKGSAFLGLMGMLGLTPSATMGQAMAAAGASESGTSLGFGEGVSYGGATGGGYGGFGLYAQGGIVPRNQIALVHEGEGVFTPEQLKHLSPGGGVNITIQAGVITTNDVDSWLADRVTRLRRRGQLSFRNEMVTAGIR